MSSAKTSGGPIRHDTILCTSPGLFRSLKKEGGDRGGLYIFHDFGEKRVKFSGPEKLGADDLRVLQGLMSLAAKNHRILPAEPESAKDKHARGQLSLKWDACHQNVLEVKSSFADLAREIGRADLDDTLTMRRCIYRMSRVSMEIENKSIRRGFRLLAIYEADEKGPAGQLRVGLNPQITEIILGRSAKHACINMGEARSLKTDSARLIHQRLCGWISPGKSGKATIDTLCNYVWPEDAMNDAVRQRRVRARKAIGELVSLGWIAEEYQSGVYKISRPAKESMLAFRGEIPAKAA